MKTIRFRNFTRRSVPEFRSALEQSLGQSFASHLMQKTWRHNVLAIWGPGAEGDICLQGEQILVTLHLTFPATLAEAKIVHDVAEIIDRVGERRTEVIFD